MVPFFLVTLTSYEVTRQDGAGEGVKVLTSNISGSLSQSTSINSLTMLMNLNSDVSSLFGQLMV